MDVMSLRSTAVVERLLPIAEWLARHYVRLDVAGTDHITPEPTLYVSNHSGGIMGADIACSFATLWRTLGADAPLYALAHDFAMRTVRPIGSLMELCGAVRASPENALEILDRGGSVLVYPGGELDTFRTFARRHEIVILPRTGFARVAIEAGVRIVPIVADGAHRSIVYLHEGERVARWVRRLTGVRIDRFPVALALPWGLAFGPVIPYVPLPFQVRMRFLPPMRFGPNVEPEAAARQVQATMQRAMDELAYSGRGLPK